MHETAEEFFEGYAHPLMVSSADVTTHVLGRTSPFTTNDIIGSTGASPCTVTKVLKQLLKAGKVDAEDGRPITYTVR